MSTPSEGRVPSYLSDEECRMLVEATHGAEPYTPEGDRMAAGSFLLTLMIVVSLAIVRAPWWIDLTAFVAGTLGSLAMVDRGCGSV